MIVPYVSPLLDVDDEVELILGRFDAECRIGLLATDLGTPCVDAGGSGGGIRDRAGAPAVDLSVDAVAPDVLRKNSSMISGRLRKNSSQFAGIKAAGALWALIADPSSGCIDVCRGTILVGVALGTA